MAQAVATAIADSHDNLERLVVTSIGTARPADAASVAHGLGVPVQNVMAALYRAPTVLVDGLLPELAQKMGDLLQGLGCVIKIEPETAAAIPTPQVFDVTLHISDAGRYSAILTALAGFLGVSTDEAAKVIAGPPAVVLGGVSQATIDALADRLGQGADLIASDPQTATYDLFLGACERFTQDRILKDLKKRGFELLGDAGCIATGLDRAAADAVWAAHNRTAALRVVNRDFLRFDIALTGGTPSDAAANVLAELAGIPAELVPRIFAEAPITILEALPNKQLEETIQALHNVGVECRADLVTFQFLGLQITKVGDRAALKHALSLVGVDTSGLDLNKLPVRLPVVLPELQARVLRSTLAEVGTQTDLIDDLSEIDT